MSLLVFAICLYVDNSAFCGGFYFPTGTGAQGAIGGKSAIPTKKQVEAAEKAIGVETGIEYQSVRPTGAASAASNLLTSVVGETNVVRRFAKLTMVMNLGSKAGEISISFKAIDLLNEEFNVNHIQLKSDVIQKRAKLRQPPANFYELSVLTALLSVECRESYRFKEALEILDDAIGYSKKAPEMAVTQQLIPLKERLRRFEAAFADVRTAKVDWESGNRNPKAATEWGRFLCLTQGNWKEGIPILAAGLPSNPLTAAAKRELEGSMDFNEIVSLSDEWLFLASGATKDDALVMKRHAWNIDQQGLRVADATQLTPMELRIAKEIGPTTVTRTRENENGLSLGGPQANIGPYATIEMWIRTNDSDGSIITKRFDKADSSVGLDIEGGTICYYAHGPTHSSLRHSTMRVDDGIWHHIAAVKLEEQLLLYVDGEIAGPPIIIENVNLSKTPWHLGYMMVEQQSPLDATYARIRISSIGRYHFSFEPDLDYTADASTLLFR